MRLLRLDHLGQTDRSIELHPQMTVITGLDDRSRIRLARGLANLSTGHVRDLAGEIEVHGIRLDITTESLAMLDLPGPVDGPEPPDSRVRAGDLPGANLSATDVADRRSELESDRRELMVRLDEASHAAATAGANSPGALDPRRSDCGRSVQRDELRLRIEALGPLDPEPMRRALEVAAGSNDGGASFRPEESGRCAPQPSSEERVLLRAELVAAGLAIDDADFRIETLIALARVWLTEQKAVAAERAALELELDSMAGQVEAERALERATAGVNSTGKGLAVIERQLASVDRRLAALVDRQGAGGSSAGPDEPSAGLVQEIEWYLLARLAEQRSTALAGSVPLILDDAFRDLGADEAVQIAGGMERMAGAVQVIVITDSEELADWAADLGPDRAAVFRLG